MTYIPRQFTHYGWFFWVPIYIGGMDTETPDVAPRWWCPNFVLTGTLNLFQGFAMLMCFLDDDFEPLFPFRITGKIEHDE